MRISDWSSDVCSSDLKPDLTKFDVAGLADLGLTGSDSFRQRYNAMVNVPLVEDQLALRVVGFYRHEEGYLDNIGTGVHNSNRSEEHTSELQSLMRISYAVFCLKKKKVTMNNIPTL